MSNHVPPPHPTLAGLVPGEATALGTVAMTALADGPVARLLGGGEPEDLLRLARYEQLSGRDGAAFERLTALRSLPLDGRVSRAAAGQRVLAIAFEPSLGTAEGTDRAEPNDDPPTELRLLVASAYRLLTTDGIDDSLDRHERWEQLLATTESMRDRFIELVARQDPRELLDAIDLLYFVPTVALSLAQSEVALDWVGRGRAAAESAGIRVMTPFLDLAEAAAHIQTLRVDRAEPLLARAVDAFTASGNTQWWMTARSIQTVLDSITRTGPTDDLALLERELVTGPWRQSRRSQGHAVLMALAMALASRGDVEGARRIAQSQGDISRLVINSTDRALLAETVFASALQDGDLDTARRMLELLDRLMPSPFVLIASERMRVQFEQASPEPALLAAQDLGPAFEVFRARWLLLAQAIARDSRDEALDALANLDAFASEARMAAVRVRAVQLFRGTPAAGAETLTTRQLEVASLAAEGYTNREISATLFISVRTVEGYLAGALRELGLSRREELASAALPIPGMTDDGVPAPGLTLRQGQVAALIAAGASNADIAQALRLSRTGVDKHVRAIKDRTGAHTRTAIAAMFASLIGAAP